MKEEPITVVRETSRRVPPLEWRRIFLSCERVLKRELLPVSVALVTEAALARLNGTYRKKTGPTNVLSFLETRDIVLAPAYVERQAKAKKISLKSWLTQLIVHAILHLEGYTHEYDRQARKMEYLEKRIINELKSSKSQVPNSK
jgi:rRNA maturation RNase YbeY